MARTRQPANDGTQSPPTHTEPKVHPVTRKVQLGTLALVKMEMPAGKAISRIVEAANAVRKGVADPPPDFDRSCLHLGKQARESISDLESLLGQLRRLAEMLPKPG